MAQNMNETNTNGVNGTVPPLYENMRVGTRFPVCYARGRPVSAGRQARTARGSHGL